MGDALRWRSAERDRRGGGYQLCEGHNGRTKKKGCPTQEIEQSSSGEIVRIAWPTRTLLFDRKPKFIDKNIDCILLDNGSGDKTEAQLLEVRESYRACGELKGGIDPAGADERWKTANGALDRDSVVIFA